MSTKKFNLALVLLCIILAVFSVAAAEGTPELTHEDVMEQWTQATIERTEKYAPKVRTLSNGVQIQRTPSETAIISAQNVPGGVRSWNNKYLQADERGCAACHTDFADMLTFENLGYVHTDLHTEYDMPITYSTCYYCHTYISNQYLVSNWRDMIHGAHSNSTFTAMGGDCWSCHYADEGGEMQIWDLVKYDLLWGIESVSAADVGAEFTYDQEFCGTKDGLFTMSWFIDHHGYGEQYLEGYHRLTADTRGVDSVDLGLYDTWTIKIDGLVENPVEYTMAELIEKFPAETFKGVVHCIDNPVGGPLIGQVEMTGISVRTLLEACGVKDEALGYCAYSHATNYSFSESFEWMDKYGDGYLVYQVAGEPVKEEFGFPCFMYMPCMPADHAVREVDHIEATAASGSTYAPTNNYWIRGAKTWFPERVITPNVGIMGLEEGTIIEAYEPFTIEGWADAFHENIDAIEISMDNGKTWTKYDTSDTRPGRWVHWTFTFTPTKESAYTIMVRSVNDRGETTPEPIITMVNAKVQ